MFINEIDYCKDICKAIKGEEIFRDGGGQALSFQSKLLLVYLIFIVLLVMALGTSFYVISSKTLEENAYTNLNVLVNKMSQQLDGLISPMDFISLNLISKGNFMSSMKSLVLLDRNNPDNSRFIMEAYSEIYQELMNYTIGRNYYRVSYFNLQGDFISSNVINTLETTQFREIIDGIEWLDDVESSNGGIIIIPPYNDPWAVEEVKVFGVTRTDRSIDYNIGYIEVQKKYEELETAFSVENDSYIRIVAITKENKLLYSSGIDDPGILNYYVSLANQGNLEATTLSIPGTPLKEIVTVAGSDYTGIRILLAQDRQVLLNPLNIIKTTTVTAAIIILAISFLYVFLFSWYLTRPLLRLKKEMERTRFENLPYKINLPNTNNEIEALNAAFINLRRRLDDSIRREIDAQRLQLQANFEALQARVNPHFIYNVLNVLSNRGMMLGDTIIYDICKGVAAMLRYSTTTGSLTATLAEEVEHVRNYLRVMKKRFEDRLEYIIEVDEDLQKIQVPKIVLQPLVENSINHGFIKVDKVMRIEIYGYKNGNEWAIELHDNGQGFSLPILEELKKKAEDTVKTGTIAKNSGGIGGMGILNVHSRLWLYFKKTGFHFEIFNKQDGGACVTFRCSLGGKEGLKNDSDGSFSG